MPSLTGQLRLLVGQTDLTIRIVEGKTAATYTERASANPLHVEHCPTSSGTILTVPLHREVCLMGIVQLHAISLDLSRVEEARNAVGVADGFDVLTGGGFEAIPGVPAGEAAGGDERNQSEEGGEMHCGA